MARRSQQKSVPPIIIRLWLLRILVPLGAWRSFYGVLGFQSDFLAECLGVAELPLPADDKQAVKILRAELTKQHKQVERKKSLAESHPALEQNILKLRELCGLNDVECRILEFTVMLHTDRVLDDTADWLGESISTSRLHHILSVLLDLPGVEVRTALSSQGMLARSGLMAVDHSSNYRLKSKLELLSPTFANRLLDPTVDPVTMLRDIVVPSASPTLNLTHFEHVSESIELLRLYLSQANETRRTGVNIYIHGSPGTGKTQLARVLAHELGCELFEVASEDEDGNPVKGIRRLQAYRAAQSFFAERQAIILFDEVEDVFNDGNDLFGEKSTAQKHKAWVNRLLEQNTVPTIWLSNTVRGIDPAFVRRFDMVVELPVPSKKLRRRMVLDACGDMLPPDSIERIAASEELVPAVISRAATVARSIQEASPAMAIAPTLELLISNTLSAQGHDPLAKATGYNLDGGYDICCANASADLQAIAEGITKRREGRICLYGPPGTGKTAFGRWLADNIGIPLHVRRASDLMSKWVGGTERNIAHAFSEAQDEGALLLIDEVDSFLQDRGRARHSWEVTAVNEILAQMERYSGVLIATTNLMQDLDPAAMRRFDIKVKFDYLKPGQAWTLFEAHCAQLGLPHPSAALKTRMNRLDQLTPGDFAAASRRSRLCSIQSEESYVSALEEECALKKGHHQRAMGFV